MEQRRQSRADRRRRSELVDNDRRRGLPLDVHCLSQGQGDNLVIFVQDPIGADNAAAAKGEILRHLHEHREKNVALDLGKCTYIDTPGLTTLYEIKKALATEGRSLILQNPSRAVMRMLNITLLNRVFPVRFTTREEERIPTSHTPPK